MKYEIWNFDKRIATSDDIYTVFNNFIFSNDTKVLGKLLHRFNFFNMTKDLPGDIIEVGVFKGSGIATFSKFVDIFCNRSNKKIIGFDIFDDAKKESILDKDGEFDKSKMKIVYSRVENNDLSLAAVEARLENMQLHQRHMLIRGDVAETMPEFIKENPGFRASLIYMDADLDRPTYAALVQLWDRLLPGGVIVFDEYEYHKFSESTGVERFLKEKGISYEVKSTNWIAPTAFLVKK